MRSSSKWGKLIYYYFHTKKEIFLALLQQEYEAWIEDLISMRKSHPQMTVSQFADEPAYSLERRSRLLKLMSMNHYDMEANSRMENLVAYGNSMRAVSCCNVLNKVSLHLLQQPDGDVPVTFGSVWVS